MPAGQKIFIKRPCPVGVPLAFVKGASELHRTRVDILVLGNGGEQLNGIRRIARQIADQRRMEVMNDLEPATLAEGHQCLQGVAGLAPARQGPGQRQGRDVAAQPTVGNFLQLGGGIVQTLRADVVDNQGKPGNHALRTQFDIAPGDLGGLGNATRRKHLMHGLTEDPGVGRDVFKDSLEQPGGQRHIMNRLGVACRQIIAVRGRQRPRAPSLGPHIGGFPVHGDGLGHAGK